MKTQQSTTKTPLRGIATINFFAADHAGAKKWYSEFLGMEPYFDKPGYFEFRLGDYGQEFGVIDSKYMPEYDTSTSGPAGAVIYWYVDDLEGTLERLLGMGAELLDAPRERGEKFITASVRDPFGNVLGIMSNPHYVEMLGKIKPAE